MKIVFATSNKNKLREARMLLGADVASRSVELDEIQSLSLKDVAQRKAIDAYMLLKSPVFVEDTGLFIAKMNGFPGPMIKWVVQGIGLEGVCSLARHGKAYAKTCVAFYDGNELKSFTGRKDGRISSRPMGEGFGWDSIFMPDGKSITFAQMSLEEKNLISHRSIAFRKFKRFLKGKNIV